MTLGWKGCYGTLWFAGNWLDWLQLAWVQHHALGGVSAPKKHNKAMAFPAIREKSGSMAGQMDSSEVGSDVRLRRSAQ
jgi:hypothetical protein